MSPLRWILLCLVFTLYLLFGGFIFMMLEQTDEETSETIEHLHMENLRKDVEDILFLLDYNYYSNSTTEKDLEHIFALKSDLIHALGEKCGFNLFLNGNSSSGGGISDPSDPANKWSFYNSVFFAFTVVTTIGYGHLYPTERWSKIFMICYALVGIPLNTILLSSLADYFSNHILKVHKRSKERESESRLTVAFEILFYLIPGMFVFLVIPAGLFVMIEEWTFLDSLYYAFVTLTTIGFGDLVAGQRSGRTVWLWIYKSIVIVWILFGLGYLLMILGFISKGLKSKKIRAAVEKRLISIRLTRDKLTKDVEFMRRIVNELYLMKVNQENNEWEEDEEYVAMKSSQGERRFSFPGCQLKGWDRVYNWDFEVNVRRCISESDLADREEEYAEELPQVPELSPDTDVLLNKVISILNSDVMGSVKEAVDELNYLEEQEEGSAHRWVQERTSRGSSGDSEFDPSDKKNLLRKKSIQLDQVVVQKDDSSAQAPPQRRMMDRVTGVLRKISTAARPHNAVLQQPHLTDANANVDSKPMAIIEESAESGTREMKQRKISRLEQYKPSQTIKPPYYYEGQGLEPQNVFLSPTKADEPKGTETRKISDIAPLRETTSSQKAIEGIMTRARKISRMEFQEPAATLEEIPYRKISSRYLEPPSIADVMAATPIRESPTRKISQISKSSSIGSQESKSRRVSRNAETRYNHNQLFPPISTIPASPTFNHESRSPAVRRLSPKAENPVSRSNSARLRAPSEERSGLPTSRRGSGAPRGLTPDRVIGPVRSRRNSLAVPHPGGNRLSPGPPEDGRRSRKISPDASNLANLLSALTDVQRQLAVSNQPRRQRDGISAGNNGRQARHRRVGVFNPGFQLSSDDINKETSRKKP